MIGGEAYPNGVAFYTDEVWVKATRGRDQNIRVEVRRRVLSQSRWRKRVAAIPFVRGLALMGDLVMVHWRLYIAGCLGGGVLLFLMGDTLLQNGTSDSLHTFSWYAELLMLALFLAAVVVIRLTGISRYHGAEHQVVAAYLTHGDIERDKVLAASRVSARCGSNLAVFQILCYGLLTCFPLSVWSKILLSYMIGYELFLCDERGRWRWVLSPFYRISGWLQGRFLTSKPTDNELEVAESAFLTLHRLRKER